MTLRAPVPSARQEPVEAPAAPVGEQAAAPAAPVGEQAAAPAAASGEPAPRWSLRRQLREMDPRGVIGAGPRAPLIVLGLFALVTQWDDNALGLLLPEIRRDFAVDTGTILTLQAALGVVTLVLAPWLGYLADRVHRVRLLRAGSIAANAATVATGFAGGLPAFAAGRSAALAGNAVMEPLGFPLLTDYYPSRVRARMFALLAAVGYVGAIAGPILGGNLGAIFGWRVAVVSLGTAALIVSALTFLMREPVRGYQDRLEAGASDEVARIAQTPVSWGEGWRSARSIATIRRLWYAAPFLYAIGFGVLAVTQFYYADEFGIGPQGRGYIGAAGWVAAIAAVVFAGPLADRVLRDRPGRLMGVMAASMVVQALVFVVMALSPVVWLSVAANLFLQFINALFLPALYTLLSLAVPARVRGLGMQSVRPFYAGGVLLIPLVNAAGATWGVRGMMLAFAPICLAAAAIIAPAASAVARDIRAARAASMAEEEARRAREAGRAKLLVCRDVDVHYDGVQVLFGVDLDVVQGEILALLGTNGAGKSTLLRAISGVSEASSGAISIDGRDITHVPPHEIAAAGIAMVPGGRAIFPSLTVAENLRAAAIADPAAAARTDEVLGWFPALRARMNEQAGNLSGGEQQMLALSQAFLSRPRLLLIDELTLGLAPAIVEQLLAVLRLIHEQGTTIVLVEQSVNVALTIAQRAVFMEKGEVRWTGPTEELLHSGELMRSVFLGSARTGSDLVSRRRRDIDDAPDAEVLLDARDLRVTYGGVTALDGASLTLRAREITGIIGPNGAGKTTLFDAIAGVAALDGGAITLDGAEVAHLPQHVRARMGLGRSYQTARLFPTLTVRETIAVALERHLGEQNALLSMTWAPPARKSEARVARRVEHLVAVLGLEPFADRFVSELSTATRRIVDIACVMASEPRVLLLDEPSSGLAQAETEELGPVLDRLVRETGCALAIIEHDVPLVTSISHRMVAMDLGRVIATGAPGEVVGHPDVVKAYLGSSEEAIVRSGARR